MLLSCPLSCVLVVILLNEPHAKSYNSLIDMDGKLNDPKFLLCRKLHEKSPIRREMTVFPKVSKTGFFRKIAKGGLRDNFKNGRFFGQTLES